MKLRIVFIFIMVLNLLPKVCADIVLDLPKDYIHSTKIKNETKPIADNLSLTQLIGIFCDHNLKKNPEKESEYENYKLCLLNKEIAQIYLEPINLDAINEWPANHIEQKKILHHIYYQMVLKNEFNIKKFMAEKYVQYYVGLEQKAKLAFSQLQPIEKMILGHAPWATKFQVKPKFEIWIPQNLGGKKFVSLNKFYNVSAAKNSNYLVSIDGSLNFFTTNLIIESIFKDYFFPKRAPSSTDDLYNRKINHLELKIKLIDWIISHTQPTYSEMHNFQNQLTNLKNELESLTKF